MLWLVLSPSAAMRLDDGVSHSHHVKVDSWHMFHINCHNNVHVFAFLSSPYISGAVCRTPSALDNGYMMSILRWSTGDLFLEWFAHWCHRATIACSHGYSLHDDVNQMWVLVCKQVSHSAQLLLRRISNTILNPCYVLITKHNTHWLSLLSSYVRL